MPRKRNTLIINEEALELEMSNLIYPQEPMVTVAVGNKFIGFLIETTLLCKLNVQVTFSPEQFDIRVPPGLFGELFLIWRAQLNESSL